MPVNHAWVFHSLNNLRELMDFMTVQAIVRVLLLLLIMIQPIFKEQLHISHHYHQELLNFWMKDS